MKFMRTLLCGLLLIILNSMLLAQTEATVPDLTGLNVPRAAAELNRAGLKLGAQVAAVWTADSGLSPESIGGQSVAPGTTAEPGSTVDVTILRSPNVRLLYDDNDLTLINLTDKDIDLNGLILRAVDGNKAAFTRWSGALRGRQCLQAWSVNRNGPKALPECEQIQNWVVTTNSAEHFWIPNNGVTQFEVSQASDVQFTCDVVPTSQDVPTACEFYYSSEGQSGEVAEYVFFMYTTDRFVAFNSTEDKWMRLNKTVVTNPNPAQSTLGSTFTIGDPETFGNPDIIGDIKRLAPGQCLLFKSETVDANSLPQACDVIAQLDLPANELFWTSNFEFEGTGGKRYTCTAAVEGKRTMCVMPR